MAIPNGEAGMRAGDIEKMSETEGKYPGTSKGI
jgi:hypothetical protein